MYTVVSDAAVWMVKTITGARECGELLSPNGINKQDYKIMEKYNDFINFLLDTKIGVIPDHNNGPNNGSRISVLLTTAMYYVLHAKSYIVVLL